MLPEEIDAVTASYHRCLHDGGFVDTFYERFLAKGPEVAEKFRNTHFTRQKMMLRESLLTMVMFNDPGVDVQDEIDRLAERHSRGGVDIGPRFYELWLDALCEAVERHDPQFTPELADKWRGAMRRGIDVFVAAY